MVLDDDDYEVIEENNPGFHCHTSENCKRLKKVRTDVGALPLATIDNLFGADDGTFQISMLIIGCGFRMVVVVTGRSKGFDVGRALQARSFDFEEAISMVLYGINTLEEFHVTSTIRDVVRLNIKLVQREGNAVLRRHLESLPLESFYLANESDKSLPYREAKVSHCRKEFIQMYCHIAAHKFFSLCDPVRRVLFEEFLYREARIKKILRINGVAPGK
ncbi:hypothetical protein Tco_0233252 [Tanacetum coccineum]